MTSKRQPDRANGGRAFGPLLALLVAMAVFVALNVAGKVVRSRIHHVDALERRPDAGVELLRPIAKADPATEWRADWDGHVTVDGRREPPWDAVAEEPLLMVVGASYGRRGVHPREYDLVLFGGERRTVRWWCDASTPTTWDVILREPHNLPGSVRTVVLLVSPQFTRFPSPFKDIALRHVLPVGDVVRVAATGQLQDASEMLLSRALPVYQSRRGGREKVITKLLAPLGIADARHLPPPVQVEWRAWQTDILEIEGLRRIATWLRESGREVVIAEWPMSKRMRESVHSQVAESFRPLISEVARECGAGWIPQPDQPLWDFVDNVHPTTEQGVAISRWMAQRMLEAAIVDGTAGVGAAKGGGR